MKSKVLVRSSLIMMAALMCGSASLLATKKSDKEFIISYATQHSANYDAYTYSGSYYSSIPSNATEGMSGSLRTNLTTLIYPKAFYTYSGDAASALGTILQSADEDPTNSNNMVLVYTRDSITKRPSASASNWNREHVWPQANSNNSWGTTKAGADLLHIRPTYETCNSSRGNLLYGDVTTGAQTYNGMTYGYKSSKYFAPLDASKGDVARICMYIWVAYYNEYGSSHPALTKVFQSFDVMMRWHIQDRPDALEGHRNDYSEKTSNQRNRNPFVDHPEYAWKIFGSQLSASVLAQAKEAYPDGGTPTPPPPPVEGSISLTKHTISDLEKGKKASITATTSDSSNVTWAVSDNTVTTLSKAISQSGETIIINALKAGTSVITAKATINGEQYSDSCTVTVKAAAKKSGCGGSLIGGSVLISVMAVGFVSFLLIRRKKYN